MRRVFVEDHDRVDACQRAQHFGALSLGVDRPIVPFVQRPGRPVGVDGDDQRVAELARLLQIAHVARVQQIEDAVGEDDLLAAPAPPRHPGDRVVDC